MVDRPEVGRASPLLVRWRGNPRAAAQNRDDVEGGHAGAAKDRAFSDQVLMSQVEELEASLRADPP
jgi:hypothetical protein